MVETACEPGGLMTRRTPRILCGLLVAQCASAATSQSTVPAGRPDGQRDFDFHIGSWKTHLRRLQKPLTGSTTWVE